MVLPDCAVLCCAVRSVLVRFFRRLVSGGQDNTLRVWDISTCALMATILPASGHAGAIVVRALILGVHSLSYD